MTVSPFVWPLNGGTTPDEMNTSFGPRIDANRWDFHDGIDLPAPGGTPVHAMADGVVHRAGPADSTGARGFGSTHVIVRVVDPTDSQDNLYLVYLHLDRIAKGIVPGSAVQQGDVIGAVGQEDAMYPHLHFEFRKGSTAEKNSRHPLHYLPYPDTPNFSTPALDRCNFSGAGGQIRAIRVRFDVANRREGDLQGVVVELQESNGGPPEQRSVDFDDRATIASAKGETNAFNVNGVAVEGYQKSNLKGDNRNRLLYGVIVKNIGSQFTSARVRVRGSRGVDSPAVFLSIPTLENGALPIDGTASFDCPPFPPADWTVRVKQDNICRRSAAAAIDGERGLECQDHPGAQTGLIRAGLQFALPVGRLPVRPMSWRLRAKLRVVQFPTDPGTVLFPLAFLAAGNLVAAACLRRIHSGELIAGLVIRTADGMLRERIDFEHAAIPPGTTPRCELELLRIGTRETTAVLWLNGNRITQLDGHSATVEPDHACAGILHHQKPMPATLHFDDLFLTEKLR